MKQAIYLPCVLGLIALSLVNSHADPRRYGYVYESTTMPKGEWEYEQWFTWSGFPGKDRFDFRHEFEYGVTDRFQLALYAADWRVESLDGGGTHADYQDTALEAIYNLTDPYEDLFGSALYGEVKLGDEKFVLESKFIAEKNFGKFNAAYNFIFEAEWEGESLSRLDEEKGEFGNALGISYQFSPRFLAGIELLHEWELEHWSETSDHSLFIGPNVSWRRNRSFLTATALWEVADADGAADNQIRMLAGFHF